MQTRQTRHQHYGLVECIASLAKYNSKKLAQYTNTIQKKMFIIYINIIVYIYIHYLCSLSYVYVYIYIFFDIYNFTRSSFHPLHFAFPLLATSPVSMVPVASSTVVSTVSPATSRFLDVFGGIRKSPEVSPNF